MLKSVLLIAALLVADTSAVKITSDPICSSAGCDQYKHKGRALGYDLDYKVPNFGEDTDITAAKKHIAQQEKIHGVWQVQQDDNGNYIVPEAADNNSYSYKA